MHVKAGLLAGVAAILTVVTPGTAAATGDKDAVRAVLDGMNGSYNRANFGEFAEHVCADMRRAAGFEAGWRQSRKADGPTRITVNSISVSGSPAESAVANVRFVAARHDKTLDVEFRREGSQWKACRYQTGQAV